MSMSVRDARVVDPILTKQVQGYANAEFVGGLLFPRVDTPVRGGKIIEFGKEAFRQYNARRAPGADAKQISFGFEGKPYELVQDSLDAKVPRESMQDARAVPGIDLGLRATNVVMCVLTLGLEVEQAGIATNPGSYLVTHRAAPTGTAKWSHDDSDPEAVIDDGKETVRASIGMHPNLLILGPKVFKRLRRHPKIRGLVAGISADAITPETLARMLDIPRVKVGKAVTVEGAAADAPFVDVWGENAVLAYAPETSEGREEPSYGYTYTLDGNPFVEAPYWKPEACSWIYGVTHERKPVLTGMSAGFLFSDVL